MNLIKNTCHIQMNWFKSSKLYNNNFKHATIYRILYLLTHPKKSNKDDFSNQRPRETLTVLYW